MLKDFCLIQVSALTLDPSGARLVTGGYDYEVRFWDFAGMDSSLQSFRTIHPCERLVCKHKHTELITKTYVQCHVSWAISGSVS